LSNERSGALLDMGLLTRVWPNRREHDVGVMIHPNYRRREERDTQTGAASIGCVPRGWLRVPVHSFLPTAVVT
jgi:hypothetical protein